MSSFIRMCRTSGLAMAVVLVAILGSGCAPSVPGSSAGTSSTPSPTGPTPTATTRPCPSADATFKESQEFPNGIYSMVLGPDGNLWATTEGTITRATAAGDLRSFPVSGFPYAIRVGRDQHLWFLELVKGNSRIGRISTDGGLQEFALPAGFTVDSPADFTSGPDGNMWYLAHDLLLCDQRGCHFTGVVGRITPEGVVTQFAFTQPNVGDLFSLGNPYVPTTVKLTAGGDGNVWFAAYQDRGLHPDGQTPVPQAEPNRWHFGKVSPGGAIQEVALPVPSDVVITIAGGPDGAVWVSLANPDNSIKVDRIDPSGNVKEYPLTSGSPTAITFAPDHSLWMVAQGSGYSSVVVRHIDSAGDEHEYSVVHRLSTNTHLVSSDQLDDQLAALPDGNIWFTERLFDYIGRVRPSGVIDDFHLPATTHAFGVPLDVAVGADGGIWYTRNFYKDTHSYPVGGVIGRMTLPSSCA